MDPRISGALGRIAQEQKYSAAQRARWARLGGRKPNRGLLEIRRDPRPVTRRRGPLPFGDDAAGGEALNLPAAFSQLVACDRAVRRDAIVGDQLGVMQHPATAPQPRQVSSTFACRGTEKAGGSARP